jgi:hypothetical protein
MTKEAGIMIKRFQKMIALCVTLTFLTLLPVYAQPSPAEPSLDQDNERRSGAELH